MFGMSSRNVSFLRCAKRHCLSAVSGGDFVCRRARMKLCEQICRCLHRRRSAVCVKGSAQSVAESLQSGGSQKIAIRKMKVGSKAAANSPAALHVCQLTFFRLKNRQATCSV